ncbi:MAG: isopentenyl transferase family protein, partial [Clostridia bacterium]|nr:isopentenyl transferase family protein [Clostridia bacterium]
MENLKIPVISIIGPTASGKTDLALSLALNLDTEIISADSMQIYKEFNILSAKPEKEKLNLVKHYLIDFLSVSEEFSVSNFINMAEKHIKGIYLKGKIPILVGGTGLYIDSLLKGLKFENKKYCANNELI